MLIIKIIALNALFIISFIALLPAQPWIFAISTIAIVSLFIYFLKQAHQQNQQTLNAIEHGLRNLHDGDFAISLSAPDKGDTNSQHSQLVTLFNQVTEKLRHEKQTLYQRELLLDKVVNASDVVTILINQRDTIIFANRAAKLFLKTEQILGQQLTELLSSQIPALLEHQDKNNAILQLVMSDNNTSQNLPESGIEQSWHLSRHHLRLHGTSHQLLMLKPLTQELQRQELQTWKKVIRVINHELNNSIAPISSMCHSGTILAERINEPQLDRVFKTITGRINRLSEFIQNYSQLARISSPIYAPVNLIEMLKQLQKLYQFELSFTQPVISTNADASQIEQLLINLLKNANEQSSDKEIQVSIEQLNTHINILVRDFGSGMDNETMEKAFLPYYSTKANGSGIGLSICRDIIDNHQGQITLSNHSEGGLQVAVKLPINLIDNK